MKKPLIHALAAALYIVIIVLGIKEVSVLLPKDNIAMPMTMLGLFVLSAAIMGFLFLSEPLKLYMDGNKHEALTFFGKTVAIFAGFVVVFIILIFLI